MGNWYSTDHIAEDYIHTDITCNIEEPQQKYHLETVSNRTLGGLNYFFWIQTSPFVSAIVQPKQSPQIQQTIIKHLSSILPIFYLCYIKHKMKRSGQL